MSGSTRWLVTGASGLLGSNVGRLFRLGPEAKTMTTIAMTRTHIFPNYFAEMVQGDLTDLESLRDAIEVSQPDVVLHAGAMASHEACEANPDLAQRVNVDATKVIADVSRKIGAAFIYISTDAVFDGKTGNYSEDDAPNPFSIYGRTKLAGEEAAFSSNPESLVIRTNFFGWSQTRDRSILEFFVNNLRAKVKVKGFTDFKVTSIYAQNLACAIKLLVDNHNTGLVHLASSDSLTKYEFAVECATVFNLDADLISPSNSQSIGFITSRSRDLSLNSTRCESLLGQFLPSQRDGVLAAHRDEKGRQGR